ncbi:hypothetical protein [Ancylobacter radicis]|uniref:Sulfotransferase family protein n=1 Tax=Ancylobacter radicis TaxID=2836179 RepID=A0ABS5R729_9HYPH|nr:hypothetical protein [Ancylobacter radicis]MBS9476187.1 hypothetical protein [Ancylobacter radicis]
MDKPFIFVAGLGRCGTTMVMTMLDRGGFPVGDVPPAYEDRTPLRPGKVMMADLEPFRGVAIKWIDPTLAKLPPLMRARTIWLERDPIEQARSQFKLLGLKATRAQVRALASGIRSDTVKARQIVDRLGPVLPMTFERILAAPIIEAARIRDFLGHLDIGKASAAVIRRHTACAPDLIIEARLMRKALNG